MTLDELIRRLNNIKKHSLVNGDELVQFYCNDTGSFYPIKDVIFHDDEIISIS